MADSWKASKKQLSEPRRNVQTLKEISNQLSMLRIRNYCLLCIKSTHELSSTHELIEFLVGIHRCGYIL
jgi:hypothetical protein